QAGPPALPGTMILTPSGEGDSLTDLFSDQPAPAETLRNLPGAPSPTSTPAAEGQAKIELSQSPGQAAAAPAAKPATRRRRASRVAPMRSPEDQKGNQWYWAHEVWREHPAVHLSDCQSYVTNRPLYNIRCVSTVAGVNAPRPFVRYPR
ncbi:MAG: hypothetical protein LBE49_03840, partial [Deltaproteobacteria bacterium]|nr:hypothetical protein [Deltaproteobacteria bacterium]